MKNKSLSSLPVITNFPIWEKVYLEIAPEAFFENIQGIQIKQQVFIFSSTYDEKNKKFFILDLENESIRLEEMEYEGCFHPIYIPSLNSIYLFRFDSGYYSDYRYNLIEYNIDKKTWNIIQHKGVAPKRRSDDFTTFFHDDGLRQKIFLLGGMQMFPGDNTGSFIYSFDVKDCEWTIESYSGNFPSEIINNTPYLANKSGMSAVVYNKDKALLIGGKVLENKFSNLDNIGINSGNAPETSFSFFNEVESDDIYEFNISQMKFNKKQYTKLLDDVKFVNCSICTVKEGVYILNKGIVHFFDSIMNELSMLKPLLFNPNPIKDSILISYNNFLYIIGKFKFYEDCFIFKTSLDNLVPKWNCTKEISYEMLLNNKECSDIVFVLNAGDKNREIQVNKKVMYNFSYPLKNIIINYSLNSNHYNFNDVSFIGVYNTLKFIYSNFSDNISTYDIEIIQEMVDIIVRYRAKSLLNIVLSHIKIMNDNALVFYELAIKYNLVDLKKEAYNYISENLNGPTGIFSKEKNVNEGIELKKLLFENFFCQHPVSIQVNTVGFDIKNVTKTTVSQEKLTDIKDICKNNKIFFCLYCKKVINN